MDFTRVKIITNEPGATYQGSVWDRFLTVQTTTHKTIRVFDPECLSVELEISSFYKLVLAPTSAIISDQLVKDSEQYVFSGEIIDLNFVIGRQTFSKVKMSRAFELRIRVQTVFGSVLLSPRDFTFGDFSNPNYQPSLGDTVYWTTGKWMLMAIV